MKLQFIFLCCILKSINGFNISDFIIYPPALNSGRIVGGEVAPEGLAPYQCSLWQITGSFYCVCSILSEKWIITAAHCVDGQSPLNIRVQVGTNDLLEGGTSYLVENYTRHEKYNEPRFTNDIAVIRLKKEIKFTDKIQPIELYKEEVKEGTKALLTGWGRTGIGSPLRLQMINLNVVQTEKCRELYKGTDVGDSHICTFDKSGEGACNGDSGGPLVLDKKLIGIVNFGVPCAMGYPDAYAKISYLYNLVLKKTGL